jgi:hexosaminidase
VSALLRQVDAMAASKLNVLHWHVVDAQSFPFQSASYPLLAEKGAYHPSAQYSADDVRGVVAYGAARGVRVMPEFDVPGHSASWAAGYPGVVTRCPKLARNINNLNLSPASNETLPLLRGVLADAAALWSDAFLHLGGDEVVEGCWAEDPAVQAWMAARNTTTKGVYQYFVTQATAAAAKLGRRVIQWQEVVDFGLDVPLSTVIEVWKAGDMQSVTSAGYDVVMASGYYLDQQVPDPPSVFYEFLDTWKGMFTHDPAHNLTSAQAARILGGEAAMWGEQVSDLSIDTRIWPRAAAVAERLWSPPLPAGSTASDVTSADVARLNAHACRLQRLGVASSPVAPGFCLLP